MRNCNPLSIGILIMTQLLVVFVEPCSSAEPARKNPVMITLRPDVQFGSSVVRLVDIATISGGDVVLRDRLKKIDIEDALATGETVIVLASQIEYRLRIAGIDLEKVSIRGRGSRITSQGASSRQAESVTSTGATGLVSSEMGRKRPARDISSVSVDEGPFEREVMQAAKNCLLKRLPWTAENVDIRLAQPISADVHQIQSAEGYEFSAELRTPGPAVGRVQVRVIAEAWNKPAIEVIVHLDVRHFEKVVLATKSIERGRVIAASDVYVDRQDVTDLSDYCSVSKELIGTTAKRSIRALSLVRLNDVEGNGHSENSVLVKRRENVRMIAKIGGLSVTATGEAQQDGKLGETIRLRNTESNAFVQGRVSGSGEVEISY